jgi:hypothetical protein
MRCSLCGEGKKNSMLCFDACPILVSSLQGLVGGPTNSSFSCWNCSAISSQPLQTDASPASASRPRRRFLALTSAVSHDWTHASLPKPPDLSSRSGARAIGNLGPSLPLADLRILNKALSPPSLALRSVIRFGVLAHRPAPWLRPTNRPSLAGLLLCPASRCPSP